MKTMNLKNKIFIFWGCMDVLAVLTYCLLSFYKGHVPFYSDVHQFYGNLASLDVKGWDSFYIQVFFVLNILMHLSLFYSSYAFMIKRDVALSFFCCQEFLRIFSLTCSLTFIPYLLNFIDGYPWYLGVSFFIFSEIGKVSTFLWCRKSSQAIS
jgi:hypothetical protein